MTRAQLQLIQAEAASDDRRITSEAELQRCVAALLDRLGLLWCHVPNEGRHHVKYRMEQLRQGMKPGVPDCLVFHKPRPFLKEGRIYQYDGLAIELKHGRNKPSPDQNEWLSALHIYGWYTAICRTMSEVVAVLEQCGYVEVDGMSAQSERWEL